MSDKIGIWSLQAGNDGKETALPLEELHDTETEKRLEELLVDSPDVLLSGLKLIGRQIPTEGGPLDLLGVDSDGRLVLFELKRGTLTRDAVAQILDYASDLASRTPEDFARLVEQSSGRSGIQPIEDFSDWYQQQFPDAVEQPPTQLRLVLVGLGVDSRAKRVVNYLAASGIDVQLLTFQAFRHNGTVFLARKVETIEPASRDGKSSGGQKQDNRRHLYELARERNAEELLTAVADYVDAKVPGYRWPHKTAFTYYLAEQTEEGRPTQRSYVSLWIDQTRQGTILFSLSERAVEAAPEAVERVLSEVPVARRKSSSWTPFVLPISGDTWETVQQTIGTLLDAVVCAWRRKVEQQNASESSDIPGESDAS